MTLIKSISGIRGTIGGKVNESLTPFDALKYSISYGNMLKSKFEKPIIVIGRDARMSGNMIKNIVISGLNSIGVDVIDLDLSTTPTVEFSVVELKAHGGIIITASHNPKEWNALKLLNHRGEFISDAEGKEIVAQADALGHLEFEHVDHLGKCISNNQMLDKHIEKILSLDDVDQNAIQNCNPKIVVDAINSTGAIAIQKMLDALNINEYEILNAEMHGNFNHNPEPLAQHLTQISDYIKKHKMDIGIVVDPDVDRLCFVNEDGSMFGEEYTLVAIADYLLSKKAGNTVSNLSSTRALRDVTHKYGGQYFASAVGEVNVVKMMKENHALIGGEGNGGVIFPENHYGRDALVGIALFLSYYAEKNQSMTQIKNELPQYFMSKNKIELTPKIDVDAIIHQLHLFYKDKESCSVIDGLKIDWENGWVHLRKSNTEPIIRIYSEAKSQDEAEALANQIIYKIKELIA
jgi:phosphomannomutase